MTPSPARTGTLPVRPQIHDGEDLVAYLHRAADANHLTFTALTGLHPGSRLWEQPSPDLVRALTVATGLTTARVRAATLHGAYPGAVLSRARTGRRYHGQPATCPTCPTVPTAARLNLVVLCPRCGHLLIDHLDPHPPPPPAGITAIQDEVLTTLRRATRSAAARDRLTRLESLMSAHERALWTNWPPLLDGESLDARLCTVHFEQWAQAPGRTAARPPFVTATLLALTWPNSTTPRATRHRLDHIALLSDTWEPDPADVPDWPDYPMASAGLRHHLDTLGVRFAHVPTLLRVADDPLVLPGYIDPARTAEALVLAALTSAPTSHRVHATSIRRIADVQGHTVTSRTVRLAEWMTGDAYSLRRLAVHATTLHADGLADLHTRRRHLRSITRLPAGLVDSLPQPARVEPSARETAAAWIWLDATRGRTAGGPHPTMSPARIQAFHDALNPEGRLQLRQWWQDLLDQAELAALDPTQAATQAGTTAGTSDGISSDVAGG